MRGLGLVDLSLHLAADWANVERARRGVQSIVAASNGDGEVAEELGMVASELIENALRYGQVEAGVDLRLFRDKDALIIEVTNACDTPDRAQELEDRILRISSGTDPAQTYRDAMDERAANDRDGGLGLARIVYEGRCQLACDRSKPGEITVRATCRSGGPLRR